LHGAQHKQPPGDQFIGRQAGKAGAFQADELRDIFKDLREDELAAMRNHRDAARTEREQLLPSASVVQDVNGDEVDTLLRKKLFRPETAASPGLGVEDVLFGNGGHGEILVRGVGRLRC